MKELSMHMSEPATTHTGLRKDIIAVFTDGDEVYADMLWHIRNARESIRLECYIFENDAIGREFGEALVERARAGVKVQLHIDAIGSFSLAMSPLPDALLEAGIELKWFNAPGWRRLLKLNRRNHRKLLVVDDTTAWLGGFNIHEESSEHCSAEECWRDTHVRVKGPLAREAGEFFDRLWRGDRGWRAHVEKGRRAFLVSNHNFRQVHRFRRLLKRRMRNARREVWLTTPYFMPDFGTQREMAHAARRGIDVRLLVPYKTDRPVTQWVARAAYADLLAAGVRIYEYCPRILHAKTVVIDRTWTTIGTANLDYRSFYVNFELNLISTYPDLAAQLVEIFQHDISLSREITAANWKRRSHSIRLTELIGWVARRFL